MAFIFAKIKINSNIDFDEIIQKSKEWLAKYPNIIFAGGGEGFGKDIVILSLHKNYSSYSTFIRLFSFNFRSLLDNYESFLVNIDSRYTLRNFDLKYLAEDI